jgi:hypothetical protein
LDSTISKSFNSGDWRQLYRAALSESDKTKLPLRIAEAERAVVLRARELFHGMGGESSDNEETQALDNVMYALHVLQNNINRLGI